MSIFLTGVDRIAAHARDEGMCESCGSCNYAPWALYGVSLYNVSDILLCEDCLFDLRVEIVSLTEALIERDKEKAKG